MTSSDKLTEAASQQPTGQPSPAVEAFQTAQRRVLDRYGITATSRFIDVPAIDGTAHVLVAGEGPPLVLVIGGTIPAAMWAPLLPRLAGYTVYAMDLPGWGLTSAVEYRTATMRATAVGFLAQVLDAIGVERGQFVTNSQGSLWTTWLSLDRPGRVAAQVQIGCPAHVLGATAPLPMRLMSVPGLGSVLLKVPSPSQRQVERVFAMVREDASQVPELRDLLLACERLPRYGPSTLSLLRAVMRAGRTRPQIRLGRDELSRVGHPVQLIWGEHDPFGSVSLARRVVAILPDAQLHLVPGGHAPWFNGAGVVGALARRFLTDHR